MSYDLPFQSEIDNAQTADSTSPLLSHSQRLTVAIPAFNEALAIGSVVVRARQYADSIIVVDDGSDDDTQP